jgi:hypothetical protein
VPRTRLNRISILDNAPGDVLVARAKTFNTDLVTISQLPRSAIYVCQPRQHLSLDIAPLPPAATRAYERRDSRRRPRPETLRDGKDFLHLRSTTLLSQMKQAIVQHRFSPAEQPRSAPLRDLYLFHVELAAPTGSKLLWVQVIGPGQFRHTLRSIKTLFRSQHPTPPPHERVSNGLCQNVGFDDDVPEQHSTQPSKTARRLLMG